MPDTDASVDSDGTAASASVDDLIGLRPVSDEAVLRSLQLGYERDKVYTALGPVLIAVNPYKPLKSCSIESIRAMNERARAVDTARQSTQGRAKGHFLHSFAV